ncbi:hypothetical protein GCM10023221_20390 [Luteimicrobium xylanilyticum]|uniref:Uncharacterized protein n=1 Tax=Luteimicrobium xylanilyticum TaxID=1133546 RepID=A0A5P9Q6J7_9MICO|nr:hypothetical protein [Luteimicrobium xylanilyticum]QFU97027.1 hypothetical protein KDY119_00520 [Luteimicrobium xylanilyticum]
MSHREDDLRTVVEHRGAALVAHARTLVEPADETTEAPVELTVDALVATFRRTGRTSGEHGSVRLLTDDDLDLLEAAVRREQDRLAGRRTAGTTEPPPPDDGPSDALSARLPEVVARVRVARRLRRRHVVVGAVAGVVAAALVVAAVAVRPWGRDTPDAVPTAAKDACGTTLPTSGSLYPVRSETQDDGDRAILADDTWTGQYTGDASGLTADGLAVLDTLSPQVVLAAKGKVVGLGIPTATYQQELDGTVSSASSRWPGIGGLTATALDLGYRGTVKTSPVQVAVRFVPCGGGTVPAGGYEAYLYGAADDGSAHVLSDAAPVTVLPDAPAGYQPRWLEGSALACGETVDEFFTRITGHPYTGLEQKDPGPRDDPTTFVFRNRTETAEVVGAPRRAALAWVKDGTIVGLGADERGPRTTIEPGRSLRLATRPLSTTDYCDPAQDGRRGRLAPGTYRVFAYARFETGDEPDPFDWFISTPGYSFAVVHQDGSASFTKAETTHD